MWFDILGAWRWCLQSVLALNNARSDHSMYALILPDTCKPIECGPQATKLSAARLHPTMHQEGPRLIKRSLRCHCALPQTGPMQPRLGHDKMPKIPRHTEPRLDRPAGTPKYLETWKASHETLNRTPRPDHYSRAFCSCSVVVRARGLRGPGASRAALPRRAGRCMGAFPG